MSNGRGTVQPVAVDVLLPAAGDGLGVLGVEGGELLQHRLAAGLGRGLDLGGRGVGAHAV